MPTDPKSEERHLTLKLARDPLDLRAAQRLRYRVFVEELGATGPGVDHQNRIEADEFDAYYDHLLLIDRRIDPSSEDHVVGVYRLLRGEVALGGPGFYSAGEYDLEPLIATGRPLLELGRSCVDPAHRGGAAMVMLWNALAEYVVRHGIEIMFGVASYHGTDLKRIKQSLAYLHHNHLAPEEIRVRVKSPHYQTLDLVPAEHVDRKQAMLETPALIRGYLRLGGFIGDGAFIDRQFNTVDVCLLMDTARMSERHRSVYQRRGEKQGRFA